MHTYIEGADRKPRGFGLPLLCSFLFLAFSPLRLGAVETPDSIEASYYDLDSLEVVGTRIRSLDKGGSMQLNPDRLLTGMRMMGEADAIKLLSRQSGVTTSGDYGSGLFIDGNLPSHVLYRIDGVPVFFPYRFGGIFSVFNTGHFPLVDFERGIHNASMPGRLGAKVDFNTGRDIPSAFSGIANVGIMSSSLSIKVPVAQKLSIAFSGRISYVNQLYGWMLVKEDSGVKYDFGDLNFTVLYSPNAHNTFRFNLFGNSDLLNYDDDNYAMDTRMNWKNGLASFEWHHYGSLDMSHRLYATYFGNKLSLSLPQFSIRAPSSIASYGLSGELGSRLLADGVSISGGYEFNLYDIRLQYVNVDGIAEGSSVIPGPSRPVDARIYADSEWLLGNGLRLDAGLSLALYSHGRGFTRFAVDPRLTISIPAGPGSFSVHLGRYSQFLHQVGFSQIGLASDFWIGSKKGLEPESSYDITLDYTGRLYGPGISFSANVYARRFLHQAELLGEFLSILDSDYEAENLILSANGYAAGANVSLRKDVGPLTGSIGFGYGVARSRYARADGYTRARSEPGFTLSADVSYRFNDHWSAGGAFRFATGRPYTPVTALYIVAGNVMKEYGAPNSALLPAWHRLDLSATWSAWSGPHAHPLRHLVSVSLINAYGRRNPEFITYVIDFNKGVVKMKTVASIYRFFPSLSYTLVF